MHGLRKLTGLAVALLCLTLTGPVANSQQTKPTEPGTENDDHGRPFDDEDVVVRPKGNTTLKIASKSGKSKYGFDWSQNGQPLKEGRAKQFRSDLFERMDKLKVQKMDGNFASADAVHFDLEGFEFEVIKIKGGAYRWVFSKDTPVPCNTCSGNGVPLQYMDGKAKDGIIEARLSSDPGNWVPVQGVVMRGK
jgi:hypothetical protein